MGSSSSKVPAASNTSGQAPNPSVCAICQAIDFTRIRSILTSNKSIREYQAVLITKFLGTYHRISSTKNCALCTALINRSLETHWMLKKSDQLALYAAPVCAEWPLFGSEKDSTKRQRFHFCLFLWRWKQSAEERGTSRQELVSRSIQNYVENRAAQEGLLVLSTPGRGRPPVPLRNDYFDPALAREWIKYCENKHGEECAPLPISRFEQEEIPGMKLIDCETLEIKAAPKGAKWVALSYVWSVAHGTTTMKPTDTTAEDDTGTVIKLEDLPGVIADAILVAKRLDYRYLWVDRYCIRQDRLDEVRHQIALLDRIYRNAELTIIAAGQGNNLTGVDKRKRPSPFSIIEISPDIKIYQTAQDPQVVWAVRNSAWYARGWTFQEAILSRRRLFFTEHEMLMECNRCSYGEEDEHIAPHQLASHSAIQKGKPRSVYPEAVRIIETLMTQDKGSEPKATPRDLVNYLHSLFSLIRTFKLKTLSHESDTLDAFSGAMKLFERTECEIRNLHGIPFVSKFYKYHGDAQTKAFVMGLAWTLHSTYDPPRRRNQFPSWSWADWEGHTEWHFDIHDSKTPGKNFVPLVSIERVVCQCSKSSTLGEAWEDFREADRGQHQHQPEHVIVSGQTMPPEIWIEEPALSEYSTGSIIIRGDLRYPQDQYFMATRYQSWRPEPRTLISQLESGKLLALILGVQYEKSSVIVFVMMIDIEEENGEREGRRRNLMIFTKHAESGANRAPLLDSDLLPTIRLRLY